MWNAHARMQLRHASLINFGLDPKNAWAVVLVRILQNRVFKAKLPPDMVFLISVFRLATLFTTIDDIILDFRDRWPCNGLYRCI